MRLAEKLNWKGLNSVTVGLQKNQDHYFGA
jgi:hypothetical protein